MTLIIEQIPPENVKKCSCGNFVVKELGFYLCDCGELLIPRDISIDYLKSKTHDIKRRR